MKSVVCKEDTIKASSLFHGRPFKIVRERKNTVEPLKN